VRPGGGHADTAGMRLAARLLKSVPGASSTPIALDADPFRPRLVRCECRDCGAHCNAIAARDVHASCGNCGASRLVPVAGASVILGG
jgi:hypothetical protein